jgi:hypothetical protein
VAELLLETEMVLAEGVQDSSVDADCKALAPVRKAGLMFFPVRCVGKLGVNTLLEWVASWKCLPCMKLACPAAGCVRRCLMRNWQQSDWLPCSALLLSCSDLTNLLLRRI